MNTNDTQFQLAYNDLVGAFFRFINVVNPAPTPQAQVQLICNALQSLVSTLGDNPYFQNPIEVASTTYETSNNTTTSVPTDDKPSGSGSNVTQEPSQPVPTPEPQQKIYTEKRYAPEPTLTADEVYRFIIRSLKKPEAFDPEKAQDDPLDMAAYPVIIEFNGEEGIFWLNKDALSQTGIPQFPKEVAEISGQPTKDNIVVSQPGRIIKTTGAWEVISPMKLAEAAN